MATDDTTIQQLRQLVTSQQAQILEYQQASAERDQDLVNELRSVNRDAETLSQAIKELQRAMAPFESANAAPRSRESDDDVLDPAEPQSLSHSRQIGIVRSATSKLQELRKAFTPASMGSPEDTNSKTRLDKSDDLGTVSQHITQGSSEIPSASVPHPVSVQTPDYDAGDETEEDHSSTDVDTTHDWVVDSGCTHHMYTDQNDFIKYRTDRSKITLANGATIWSKGQGTVKMECLLPDGSSNTMSIKRVLHVPDLTSGFFSISQATREWMTVTFFGDKCHISKAGQLIGSAPKVNNTYTLSVKVKEAAALR